MCGTFPLSTGEGFDLVLSSHSVPEDKIERYGGFLQSAWQHLNLGGMLVVITFKGSRGDVATLREEIVGKPFGADPQLKAITDSLSDHGPVKVERISSYLQSSDPDDIVKWVSGSVFRQGEETASRTDRLREILQTRYRLGGRFIFPQQHLVITISKTGS